MSAVAFSLAVVSIAISCAALTTTIIVARRTSLSTTARTAANMVTIEYFHDQAICLITNGSDEPINVETICWGDGSLTGPKPSRVIPGKPLPVEVPAELSRDDAEGSSMIWEDCRFWLWERQCGGVPSLKAKAERQGLLIKLKRV